MRRICSKTDNLKRKAGRAVLPRDRHDASSRSGLLLRLFSAALALMLAVGGVSLLHLSFSEQLPVVQAANGEIITEATGSTWDSNINMAPDQTTVQVVKIFLGATPTPSSDNGGSMIIRAGKTVEMVPDGGSNDSSVIQILQGASLHLHGAMTGHFDELTIANKESTLASRDGHFYIYLYDGATFTATYNSDMFTEGAAGVKSNKFECLGCNIGSNLENREKYPDVDFDKTTDMPVTSNIAMTLPNGSETNNVTDSFIGRFSLDDPGPIYTITANPKEGYSQVVWTKGPKGEVIETDSDSDHAADPNVVVNGNTVGIHLKEHVKYQVYATYIPDPVWTWDEDNNPTITVYSYDPEDENSDGEGIISQTYDTPVISDTVVDPAATCTEGGKTTYKAFVVVNGTTYRNDHTVDTEALGHDLRDDWIVTEEPTQTETGTKIRYCHRDGCTYSETEEIAKLGGGGNGDDNGGGDSTTQPGDSTTQPGAGTTQPGGGNNTNNNGGTNTDNGKGDWNPKTVDSNFRFFLAGWFFIASAGTIIMLLFQNRKKRYSHR
ncbi:MAG: hypothetical protein II711_02210 [Clostridia bacterium]|nr:hypothetical protein [Clostridia bacterium]